VSIVENAAIVAAAMCCWIFFMAGKCYGWVEGA
jgi:hypothetical protein